MSINQTTFLQALANTVALAQSTPWHYGDSQSLPPCADGYISCDRLVSRSLYDLGARDQPAGGWISSQLAIMLPTLGFISTSDRSQIIPGTVCIVGLGDDTTFHTFAVTAYDPNTDLCSKYDMGSESRIQQPQPFTNVPLVEWPDRYLSYIFLPPSGGGGGGKAWLWFKHYKWRESNNGCSCILS